MKTLQSYELKDIRKSKYPFEEYLKNVHAENYMGTDDHMSDSFEDWISTFDIEEVIQHADYFGKLLLKCIPES